MALTSRTTGPTLALEPDARSVRTAREHVRRVLTEAGLDALVEPAVLAVSELVTNAVVHTGGVVGVRVLVDDGGVRVEVDDCGLGMPRERPLSPSAGTGRGLRLVDDAVDRWGASGHDEGKTVWFELARPGSRPSPQAEQPSDTPYLREDVPAVPVVLQGLPLREHLRWQEHASALLREHLLHALGEGGAVLRDHASASEAMGLLDAQVPRPEEGEAPVVRVRVPLATVPAFLLLDRLLDRAVGEALAGRFLAPATRPEVERLRHWILGEVQRQAAGLDPLPWSPGQDGS